MATIITRAGKGSALTFTELDANFTNLNNESAVALRSGFRNVLINGAFEIWQRGTSRSYTTSGDFTADRWWNAHTGASSGNFAQTTDTPSGFAYAFSNDTNGTVSIGQAVEFADVGRPGGLIGEYSDWILSFYGKATTTDSIDAAIRYRDTRFSATNEAIWTAVDSSTFNLTSTWQRFSCRFTRPSANGTNILAGLELTGLAAGTKITGVQLEPGSIMTPFEHRGWAFEVPACQRYYCVTGATIRANAGAGGTFWENRVYWPVTMRGNPAVTSLAGPRNNVDSITYDSAGDTGCRCSMLATNSGDAYALADTVYADAEV